MLWEISCYSCHMLLVIMFLAHQCMYINIFYKSILFIYLKIFLTDFRFLLKTMVIFFQADNIISVVDVDSSSIVLSHRLTPMNTPPLDKGTPVYLTLQEILIVGNCNEQVIFCKLWNFLDKDNFFLNIRSSHK